MVREILVQVEDEETKVAVLEDGQLVEIYVERAPDERLVGNIYKGIVKNVLPGMQAAFVDIGQGKNAFLYVEDALANTLYAEGENFAGKKTPASISGILSKKVRKSLSRSPKNRPGPKAPA